MLRILVVSQHFWPESFRINQVVSSLIKQGCEVTVLAGQPNYPAGITYAGYSSFGAGVEIHPEGYSIVRVPELPRGTGRARQLIANYLSFVVAGCLLGPFFLFGRKFDLIFVYGTSPILQAIPAIVLKWLKRARLVLWVQDLWPESLEATGYVRNKTVLNLVGSVVRWIYRRADLILGQSEAFVTAIRPMAGTVPIAYHPNPGETFDGLDDSAPAYRLDPGFNVVFAGNMGKAQGMMTLVDAAEKLRGEEDIRLVLVGDGALAEALRQRVNELGLRNVVFAGRFPPETMPGILAQASALLVSLADYPILNMTVPSKVQSYLSAGRPIIASMNGEGARIIAESGAGVTCPADDAEALAQCILDLRGQSPEARLAMGESGRAYHRQHYEPEALGAKLRSHFARTLGTASGGKDSDGRD